MKLCKMLYFLHMFKCYYYCFLNFQIISDLQISQSYFISSSWVIPGLSYELMNSFVLFLWFSNFILQIDVGKLSEYVIPMGGGLDIPPNFYILLPCILTALCLPLVITRAVMMDLDCFVFKKSQLFVQTEKYVESQHQLPKILQKNINSKKITCRLNIVLLCSTFVNLIVVLLLILFGILIFMLLSW